MQRLQGSRRHHPAFFPGRRGRRKRAKICAAETCIARKSFRHHKSLPSDSDEESSRDGCGTRTFAQPAGARPWNTRRFRYEPRLTSGNMMSRRSLVGQHMFRPRRIAMKALIGLFCALLCVRPALAEDALQQLNDHLGKSPALVVVVCSGHQRERELIADLIGETPWTLFCQGDRIGQIRDWARQEGHLGGRISVIDNAGSSLWLASDMADAVWVLPDVATSPSTEEIERVLHPGGISITPASHQGQAGSRGHRPMATPLPRSGQQRRLPGRTGSIAG